MVELDRLAHLGHEVDAAAAELAGLRSALRSRAAALGWHSGAAQAFQAVLLELLGQLGRSGSRLTELAAAIRQHRQRAAGRAAMVARLAHSALDTAERAVRRP